MDIQEEKKVVLVKDDIDNIENFFSHFKIDPPQILKDQIQLWKTNDTEDRPYTIQDQDNLKHALAYAFVDAHEKQAHEILSNDVWTGILKNCGDAYYNAQFDKDLEEELTKEDGESNA